MLYTILVVLVILWLLGLATATAMEVHTRAHRGPAANHQRTPSDLTGRVSPEAGVPISW
jgi:hypothetical protein